MNCAGKLLKGFLAINLTVLFCTAFSGCKADEEITQTPVADESLRIARESLKDSIVFNARAMMGTVNKTLLERGCPVKYYFKWKTDETVNMQIIHFTVGKMPVTISFSINLKFMQLNTWEKQEYTGAGWIKFQGANGITIMNANTDGYEDGTGGAGTVTGYFNAETKEMEFVTSFNVMNMSTDVYLQKIDYSRMATYEQDFRQYEEDLARYKEEHGMN
ncbi:MAG: DUF4903 domain-containing protein [Prevotellaceae bacterium]|jgi:hypothetical protein|nr:DUF4903 domain-containing protein [Prevotellaceae bacterium]